MNEDSDTRKPIRRDPSAAITFVTFITLFVAVCSGGMMGLGLPNLITGDGLWVFAKVALLMVSATVIAFAVNKLAIERGAPLAVIGYPFGGIVSVAAILFIGSALFATTYSGLVYRDVSLLKLEEHGEDFSRQIAAQNEIAGSAARLGPAAQTVVADLSAKRDCEVRASCISGRGAGGYGTVARSVEEKLGKAQAIASQIERSHTTRSDALAELNGLIALYQAVLSDEARTIEDRRSELQTVDARIRQSVNDLSEAMPVALVAAYANELLAGTNVHERPEATQRLNAILSGHGEALRAVVNSIDAEALDFPPFPGKTGVIDTFSYVPHFLPVAAVAAMVDLVLPITLWIFTALTLAWKLYRDERPAPRKAPKIDLLAEFYDDDDPGASAPNGDVPKKRHRPTDPRPNGHRPPPGMDL